MEKYFRKSGIAEGDENDAKWLHICDKLLSIMMDEDTALKYEENRVETKDSLGLPYYKDYLIKHINERNAYRFFDEGMMKFLNVPKYDTKNIFLNDLRIEKAKHLYYKIRENFTFNWWN